MPYNRVENVLMQFGKKAKEIAGIGAFGEDIGVNILKILFNVKNVEELRKRYPDERGK